MVDTLSRSRVLDGKFRELANAGKVSISQRHFFKKYTKYTTE